jgi:hypothetical protein
MQTMMTGLGVFDGGTPQFVETWTAYVHDVGSSSGVHP